MTEGCYRIYITRTILHNGLNDYVVFEFMWFL